SEPGFVAFIEQRDNHEPLRAWGCFVHERAIGQQRIQAPIAIEHREQCGIDIGGIDGDGHQISPETTNPLRCNSSFNESYMARRARIIVGTKTLPAGIEPRLAPIELCRAWLP